LNFSAGDIVPNAVQVGLPTAGANAGKIDITYDAFGVAGPTTEVLIDVVGYLTAGGAGTGPAGPAGARGFSAWDAIPSGQTVTGSMIWDEAVIANNEDFEIYVPFPAKATPAVLSSGLVNFNADSNPATTDDDPMCTGTAILPTAPAGRVCIYLSGSTRVDSVDGRHNFMNGSDGFYVRAVANGSPGQDMNVFFTWAYTAP
jgi:hypothetical protein